MRLPWTRPAGWCTAGFLAVAVNPGAPRADDPPPPTKAVVELRTKAVVANAAPTAPAKADIDNPTVAPGLVKWHPSFAGACAAAKKSGKPVLVFHMMGQLDKQFC
jgi:hypothetical protein